MASRQEEKERRRQERMEREQAEARKAAMRRRLQLVFGGLLGLAAIGAVVAVIAGGGSDEAGGDDGPAKTASSNTPIPAQQIADLDEAAKKAGCVVKTFPSEGRNHLSGDDATFDKYKTNPPTSGTHRPRWAEDGVYEPGNEPDVENWVHSLEHGRIIFQYAPGTPQKRISQLETLFNEPTKGQEGYHQLVFRNNSKMEFAVAAVAWTHYAACEEFTDETFDVFRAFRARFIDKGPEFVP